MSVQQISILLVEDNRPEARIIKELISSVFDGAEIDHVDTLAAATDFMASTKSLDAVLLDLSLPDSVGMKTVERACRAAGSVPVLVLSGDGDEALAARAVEAGAQDYLVKEFVNAFYLKRAIQYAMERKRSQAEVTRLNRELIDASRRAGMAEVASGVLHNIGNVLTGVNTSAGIASERIRQSKMLGLSKAARLVGEHVDDLADFMVHDERGRILPQYLAKLAEQWSAEQADVLKELESLCASVEHINNIVAVQLDYARGTPIVDRFNIAELVEQVIQLQAIASQRRHIEIVREIEDVPDIVADRHQLLQILINLIRNATDALDASDRHDRRLTLRLRVAGDDRISVEVIDNGVGIEKPALTQIFAHGYTTKKAGHGFGLHSAALAARDMGGSLTAHSDGPGRGAVFALNLPRERLTEAHHA